MDRYPGIPMFSPADVGNSVELTCKNWEVWEVVTSKTLKNSDCAQENRDINQHTSIIHRYDE